MKKKNKGGRPRILRSPVRLNLYLEKHHLRYLKRLCPGAKGPSEAVRWLIETEAGGLVLF